MTLPRRILNILTLRCAAASELASQAMDEPLKLPERLALRGHQLVCSPCRRFRDQLALIRDLCRRRGDLPPEFDREGEGLSDEARDRITRAIRDAGPNRET
jgi:hypothetical protein